MTYDEAIDRMAKAVWHAVPDCVEWPDVSEESRGALMAEARAAAEAIGLREMMEDAKVGREIRTNPKAFVAYRPVRSSGP